MHGMGVYLGVGFTLLGLAYTLTVLFVRGAFFGQERHPYLLNGIALCILGVSAIGRDLFLPRWIVYILWAGAAYLAVRANREIMAARGDAPRRRPRRVARQGGNGRK
ncbi:MAG: hypothetical protein HY321_20610 [Armatimonadetes bacterium]|nr:hypothetical protein [Armatimonadota bacterium]